MKFAICNELFTDWPPEKACEYVASLGYTGWEIAPFTLGPTAELISASARARTRTIAADCGLEIVGLHWLLARTNGYYLTSPDGAVRRATAEYLGHLARLCRDLDGSLMVFGSPQQRNLLPGVSPAEASDYAADVLTQCLPTLEEQGVVLALEPLGPAEGDFWLTAAETARMVERIDSPYVKLHLDVKAMSSESLPIPEIIALHHSQLAHFHANDPNQLGPGMGEVDFVPILRALNEVNYSGWLSVEVFDESPGIAHIAAQSIAYLRGCGGAHLVAESRGPRLPAARRQ